MIKELVRTNRSYRRFYEDHAIDEATLREFVDLTRFAASGRNQQPLKYILSCDRERNAQIFPLLGWAGYVKEWPGPGKGERPAAYVVVLQDMELRRDIGIDHGIAAQTILLGAREKGLGGCMIATIKRAELRKALNIPDRYEILMVLALGKPKERVVIEPLGPEGDIKYWRDSEGVHHVPKRSLDEIIIG